MDTTETATDTPTQDVPETAGSARNGASKGKGKKQKAPKVPETLTVRNPSTGAVLAELHQAGSEEMLAMVQRAREAQPRWEAIGVESRVALLEKLRTWIYEHEDEFTRTLSQEGGKPIEDAFYLEFLYAMVSLKYWNKRAAKLLADDRRAARTKIFFGNQTVSRHVPHGVVGVIGPWNYPYVNSMGDALPALLAGNSVILKPASKTPLTSLLVRRGMTEVGIPEDVFQVLVAPGSVGGEMVDHVDMVMFTGSTEVGRGIARRAAERLIPYSLELGGKDPMVVLSDADLDLAAKHAVYYSFINGGQTCMSIERIYVEAIVYDEFVERVKDVAANIRVGDPAGGVGTVEVGSMTVADQADIIAEQVADAVEKGATLLRGGRRIEGDDGAVFYEPTVLTDLDHTMEIMCEETFGPTLQVMKAADAEEAIKLANDSPYGLAAAVYSRDLHRAESVARRIEAGTVAINESLVFWAEPSLELGGWKTSGAGPGRHGEIGLLKYTKHQGIFINRQPKFRAPQGFPYHRGQKGIKAFMKRFLKRI